MRIHRAMKAMIVLSLAAFGARAEDASLELISNCYTYPTSSDHAWATPGIDETITATRIQAPGFSFEEDDPAGQVVMCSFTVPDDYNPSSGVEPELFLKGWSESNDNCSSPTDEYVRFAVTSRSFVGGAGLSASWPSETIGTLSFTCHSGGCGLADCSYHNELHGTNIDATAAASDWSNNEMVVLKIRRDTAHVGDTLGVNFFLAGIQLVYTK